MRNHRKIPVDKVCTNPYRDFTHTGCFTPNARRRSPACRSKPTAPSGRTGLAVCSQVTRVVYAQSVLFQTDSQNSDISNSLSTYHTMSTYNVHTDFCLGNIATWLINSILSLATQLHLIGNERSISYAYSPSTFFKIIMEIIYFLGESSVGLTQDQHKTPFIIPLKIEVSAALVTSLSSIQSSILFLILWEFIW